MSFQKIVGLLLVCLLLACGKSETLDGLYTFSGDYYNLNSSKAKAVILLAPDCPLCQNYSTEFVEMANTFGSDKLEFFGVLPGTDYEAEEIAHFKDSFQFDLPILMDSIYSYTHGLKGQVTPQFYLIDSLSNILYTGKFNNWATGLAQKRTKPTEFYLEDAVKSFLNNREVAVKYTEPIGCVIEGAE